MKDKKYDQGIKGRNDSSCGSSHKEEWKDKNIGSKKPTEFKHEGIKKGHPKQG